VRKGRMSKRKISVLAKLTANQVRQARRWHARGVPQTKIAEQLSVSQVTISNLLRGVCYGKVV
jgi:IS30 family transposase